MLICSSSTARITLSFDQLTHSIFTFGLRSRYHLSDSRFTEHLLILSSHKFFQYFRSRLKYYFPMADSKMRCLHENCPNRNETDGTVHRFMIVGLGNYPKPDTRHSIGMAAIDRLAVFLGTGLKKKGTEWGGPVGKSVMYVEALGMGVELFLFKPKTLMNINGKNVLKAAKQLDISAENIYLLHDEMELSVGKCKIKEGGSAKGHKGVLSCTENFQKSSLWPKSSESNFKGMTRLRIGIGRPECQSQVKSYVLDVIPVDDLEKIQEAIEGGINLLLQHIKTRVKSQSPRSVEET